MAETQAPEQVSENIWLLKPKTGGVMINFNSATKVYGNSGTLKTIQYGADKTKTAKIMYWGARNLLPQEREKLIAENNIIPELIGTKRDITLGTGVPFCYTEQVVTAPNGEVSIKNVPIETPPEIEEFFKKVNIRKYLRTSCNNLTTHANTFTEFVGLLGGKITSIKAMESRHTRAEEHDENGEIPNYYICGKWDDLRDKNAVISQVPAYNPDKKQQKFIYHTGDDLLHDDYYYHPRWWGGKDWIVLSNRVPVFHNRNLDNGYLIRWQIEIPKDYFKSDRSEAQGPDDVKKAKTAESEARRKFVEKLNSFLAAEDGAGRAVITTYEINRQLGKDFPGIKITPFKVDMKDEALLKLFEKSNDANISSQGVPPALASIQTPGRLGSGSETRNSFLLYVAIKTPVPREILFEPLYIVAQRNGWDSKIKFGLKDIEITKLDDNPAGQQEVQVTG